MKDLTNRDNLEQELFQRWHHPLPCLSLALDVAEKVMEENGLSLYTIKDESYILAEYFADCVEQYWLEHTTREVFRDDLYTFKNDIITHFKITL